MVAACRSGIIFCWTVKDRRTCSWSSAETMVFCEPPGRRNLTGVHNKSKERMHDLISQLHHAIRTLHGVTNEFFRSHDSPPPPTPPNSILRSTSTREGLVTLSASQHQTHSLRIDTAGLLGQKTYDTDHKRRVHVFLYFVEDSLQPKKKSLHARWIVG